MNNRKPTRLMVPLGENNYSPDLAKCTLANMQSPPRITATSPPSPTRTSLPKNSRKVPITSPAGENPKNSWEQSPHSWQCRTSTSSSIRTVPLEIFSRRDHRPVRPQEDPNGPKAQTHPGGSWRTIGKGKSWWGTGGYGEWRWASPRDQLLPEPQNSSKDVGQDHPDHTQHQRTTDWWRRTLWAILG